MIEEIEVIVGTYEEFLLGYKAKLKDNKFVFLPTFSTKSHTASVRCTSVCGKYVFSGGADDKIFVFDMSQRKEIQILMNHEGTINTLACTPDTKYLLSGGDDGRICLTRIGSWKIENCWNKAHEGSAVKYIACHPSGKLALSLGQDLFVKTWNLSTGRCVFKTNLKSKKHLGNSLECIEWSPNGDCFLLCGYRIIELISIEEKKTAREINVKSKPTCACWLSGDMFAVGLEDGKIALCLTNSDEDVYVEVDEKRIKSIAFLNKFLVIASSSGEISIWEINLNDRKLKKIVSTNIGCRPTCLSLLDLDQFKTEYILTDSELQEETKDILKTKKPNSGFKNLERVTVQYDEDDEVIAKGNQKESNKESSDSDNNSPGAFVLLNRKRKIQIENLKEVKKHIKKKHKIKALKNKNCNINGKEKYKYSMGKKN